MTKRNIIIIIFAIVVTIVCYETGVLEFSVNKLNNVRQFIHEAAHERKVLFLNQKEFLSTVNEGGLFKKLYDGYTLKEKGFIERTDEASFYQILTNISPHLAREIKAKDRIQQLLTLNSKNIFFYNTVMWETDYRMLQAILDNIYLLDMVEGNDVEEVFKEYDWEKCFDFFDKDGIIDDIYIYVLKRILDEVGIQKYDFDKIEVELIEKGLKKDKTCYGYYLTHVVIYDSKLFLDNLDSREYTHVIRELKKIAKYSMKNKNLDLAGEVYICLKELGQEGTSEFQELEKFLLNKDIANDIFNSKDQHLQLVYLLVCAYNS